ALPLAYALLEWYVRFFLVFAHCNMHKYAVRLILGCAQSQCADRGNRSSCANTVGSRRQEILGEAVRSHGMRGIIMAAVCQVTGAVPGFGHNISHSHRRTKRRFDPNIQKKSYYVPSLGRKVTLNLSVKGIKVIDARGIESVVADLQKRGVKL